MKPPAPTDPPPDHDPWLRHLDRWELRIMKIAVLCGVIIFVYKLLRYELEHTSPAKPALHQSPPAHP